MKVIIVGYDPGTTAGVAIIDTKKNVLLIKSKRYLKKKEIVEFVSGYGKPIIVAGDRFPLSKSVNKLGSMLGCKNFHPEESLSISEKWRLTNRYSDMIKNDHERDALASALKAFEKYYSLFKKVDRTLSYIGLNEYYDKVLEMLISEKVDNVTDAINKILDDIRKKKERVVKRKKVPLRKRKTELERKLKRMENDISILKKYNQSLKKRLEKAKSNIRIYQEKKPVKSDKELKKAISSLKKRLEEKESLIETLRAIRKIEFGGYVPILELEENRTSRIDDLNEKIGLQNTVLMVKDFKNIQALNDYDVAVISPEEPNEEVLSSVNFPIIHEKELNIEKIEGILAVNRKGFEERMKNAKKMGFVGWLKGHKKRRL